MACYDVEVPPEGSGVVQGSSTTVVQKIVCKQDTIYTDKANYSPPPPYYRDPCAGNITYVNFVDATISNYMERGDEISSADMLALGLNVDNVLQERARPIINFSGTSFDTGQLIKTDIYMRYKNYFDNYLVNDDGISITSLPNRVTGDEIRASDWLYVKNNVHSIARACNAVSHCNCDEVCTCNKVCSCNCNSNY